jgi:hypothetical protein
MIHKQTLVGILAVGYFPSADVFCTKRLPSGAMAQAQAVSRFGQGTLFSLLGYELKLQVRSRIENLEFLKGVEIQKYKVNPELASICSFFCQECRDGL